MKATPEEKVFNFGDIEFVVDTNKFSVKMTKTMNRMLGAARSKFSPVSKFPMNPGETEAKWAERLKKARAEGQLVDETVVRGEYESAEDHAARVNEDSMDAQDEALEVLNGWAKLFGQSLIDEDRFEQVNWPKLKAWMFEVFQEAGLKAPEFDPKR